MNSGLSQIHAARPSIELEWAKALLQPREAQAVGDGGISDVAHCTHVGLCMLHEYTFTNLNPSSVWDLINSGYTRDKIAFYRSGFSLPFADITCFILFASDFSGNLITSFTCIYLYP